jgi:hypothetical protein
MQRIADLGQAGLVDTPEKLQRDVEVVGGDPSDTCGVTPERVDLEREPTSELGGQEDGDEAPDRRYRTASFTDFEAGPGFPGA